MQGLIYVASFLCGTAGLIIAFWYVLRTGRIVKGAFIGWGLSIICVFLVAVVFPAAVSIYHEEYSRLFPEAIGVVAVMFTGWLPASIVAILAGLTRYGAKRFRSRSGQSGTKKENG